MMNVSRRHTIQGCAMVMAGSLLAASPCLAAPMRNVVAMEYVQIEPRVLADQIADVARRCWTAKDPAFAGLKFDGVEQGAEATTFRVKFKDQPKSKAVPPRYFRVLVGKAGSALGVAADQEGLDLRESIRGHINLLMKGRTVSC